jgi:hypothetical protein
MVSIFFFLFLLPGLVSHVCNLFTETATLCLDRSNKNNKEMAATLLFSLLDILHGMLTYTSSVVRLALQVETLFSCALSNSTPCSASLLFSPF